MAGARRALLVPVGGPVQVSATVAAFILTAVLAAPTSALGAHEPFTKTAGTNGGACSVCFVGLGATFAPATAVQEFADVSAEPAAASPEQQLAARLAALAKSPAAQAEGEALFRAASAPAVADISHTVLTQDGSALTALQREFLSASVLLEQANVRPILAALAEQRPLTRAQNAALTRILKRLTGNRALALIRREGELLQRHPPRLGALLSSLTENRQGTSTPRSAASSPVGEAERAFTVASASLGGKSLADATHETFADPGALKYLTGLPPLVLGMLLPPKQLLTPQLSSLHRAERASHSEIAHSASLPSCTLLGEEQSALRITNFVANTLLGDARGDTTESAIKQIAKLFGRVAGKYVRTIYYVIDPAQAFTDSVTTGEEAISTLYNSAVECGLKYFEIVPKQITRPAGVREQYSFLAHDFDRASYGGVTPETLSIEGGRCYSNGEEWECESEKAGPHTVSATFGGLRATAVLNVIAGPLAHMKLQPETATTVVGKPSPPYSVSGEDKFGNPIHLSIGTANDEVALRMMPEGAGCDYVDYVCTPAELGPHEVIAEAEHGDVVAKATLNVVTVAPVSLRLSPASSSITSGGSQAYTVEGYDAANDDLGPDTNATLSISPDGSCTGYTCTATTAGPHTVTATDGTAHGTATLTVITSYAAPCVFSSYGSPDCQSTDPLVTDEATTQGASDCTFSDNIDWGDGSPVQTVEFTGSAALEVFPIAEYTYSTPGTYSITASAPVGTSGPCEGGVGSGDNYQFTLLSSGGV